MYYSTGIAIVLCVCATAAPSQTDCLGEGRIDGRVVDSDDRPVIGAKISVLSEQCVVTGIAPTAITDEEGHFLLSGAPVGLNGVYAQKPEAGYPDTTAAIYLDDTAAPPKVVVRAAETVPGVVIRLGKTAGLVFGEIVDAESSQPVITARIRISVPDNDRVMLAMGPDLKGRFQLLVPRRPVRLTVKAPGYEPWQFVGDQSSAGVIYLESGEKKELNVKLHKLQN